MAIAPLGLVVSIVMLVIKRVFNNIRMMLATFIGLAIAVSFLSSLPLFTGGTIEKLLRDSIRSHEGRPIGTVWIQHLEGIRGKASIQEYHLADSYFRNNISWILSGDVPILGFLRYVATDTYLFWPADELQFTRTVDRRYGYLAFQSDLLDHIDFLDGGPLPTSPVDSNGDVPAIVHTSVANELSIRVGDRYSFSNLKRYDPKGVHVKIVGIWEAKNLSDAYWLYDPYITINSVFISEASMFDVVFERLPGSHHEFTWFVLVDDDYITSANVARVRSGLLFLERRMQEFVGGAKLHRSLHNLLNDFELQAQVVNLLLLILGLPTMAVVLYYVTTSFGMVLERQRSEIALLKSRGASTFHVLGIYSLEGVVMGALAFGSGLLLSRALAQLIGQTYGFLLFAQRPALTLYMTPQVNQYAAIAVAVALLASLGPAVIAARYSIIGYKQEVARSQSQSIWHRFFVDFILLGVAAYGYRMLNERETITFIEQTSELLIDPLLMLVPAISIIAVASIFLRIFPLLVDGLARLAALVAGPSTLTALRQISRAPGQYSSLILLLVITIALGSYSASAAHTIDRNFREQVYYRIPADLVLREVWRYVEETQTYIEPPFSDHYVPGVVAVTPIRKHEVYPDTRGGGSPASNLIAIDRVEFPKVAWWRSDFADVPLGGLMNALAIDQAALIVQPEFLDRYGVQIGDRVTLHLDRYPLEFFIAETTRYFPGTDPTKGFIFVANYDYIYDLIGSQPYEAWIKVEPGALSKDIVDEINGKEIYIQRIGDSRIEVNTGRVDPQRTGLFGVLSLGFIVGAVLTVLGFFLYSFLSFERRLLQMGILRAMGLSVRQLFTLLVFEQVFLIFVGVAAGTILGVLTGDLYIPFFQIGQEKQVPPFVVTTAWEDIGRLYLVLGVMLLLGLASTIWLISRMQLSRSVKLGEEQ